MVELPWVFVFELGISKGVSHNFAEFPEMKACFLCFTQGTNLKIPGGLFGKAYIKNLWPIFMDGDQLPPG